MGHIGSWSAAASQLGVELRGPMAFTLPDGRELKARMLVPQFGTDKGTLVFSDSEVLAHSQALIELGYAYSVFDAAEGNVISEDDLIEILSDWCWCGDDRTKPEWLRE